MAHPGGRPLLFETVDELKKSIEDYFNLCLPHPEEVEYYVWHEKEETYKTKNGKEKTRMVKDFSREPKREKQWEITKSRTPTVTGLAVHLKTSRRTLVNYEFKEEFFHTIKEAKDLIENHWEEMLEGSNVTGVIFNLKNNYEWRDKTEQELSNPDGTLNPMNALSVQELRKLAEKDAESS